VLLRSWISRAGLADRVGWVAVGREERDPQRFWVSVLQALRETAPFSGLVQALSAAPDPDARMIAERLLSDLELLRERAWLVVDDAHLLDAQALRQLELLIMRAPPELRFVLASRHDLRVGLHRLRLEGELEEIRAADLRFTLAEARELFEGAGLELPESALVSLVMRTEGWAAGLRLAALSLTGYPDPEQFAAEFSGSERTVAEYLIAEVLDRQDEEVRRLLLRTSILEVVNGQLAELLTGDKGGERILQDLEQANAFVVSLNPARSFFRYHQMFADMLQLELRRTAPEQVAELHRAASGWFANQRRPVEAVRHAQSAEDWALAARLLADHWPGHLDGQEATVHDLLAGFPPDAHETDAELAALLAADELAHGSLDTARAIPGPSDIRAEIGGCQNVNRLHGLAVAKDPASAASPSTPVEPVTAGELRVLRYLPTSLTVPEIASELSVSPNTVKTHMRNLYVKLGSHRRTETVIRARGLGLITPDSQPVARPGRSGAATT